MGRLLVVLICGVLFLAASRLALADDSRPPSSPTEPIVAPEPDGTPKWDGWIGAHELHVRKALDRISSARRRVTVSRPPMVLPGGRAGPGGASRAAPADSAGGEDPDALPTRLWFGPPTPNPSPGEVRFRVDLPAPAVVRVTVLDIAGRMVGEVGGPHPAGRHVLAWSAGGRVARSGVYFARLEVNGRPIGTRRLVVLR